MENYTRVIGATSTNIRTPTTGEINQGNDTLTPYDSAKNNGYYKEISQQTSDVSGELIYLIEQAGLTPDETLTQVKQAIDVVIGQTVPNATTSTQGISYLPKQITIANGTDTDHDINFSAGNFEFDDGTGQASIIALTKRLDGSFNAGNNNGGLFSGNIVGDGTYHMFAISNNDGSLTDAGFSADINAADIPTGYTKKRRIASLITNSSGNIRNGTWIFSRDGSYIFEHNSTILDVSATVSSTQAFKTLSIPDNIMVFAIFDFMSAPGGASQTTYGLASSPLHQNETPGSSNFNFLAQPDASNFRNNSGSRLSIPTNDKTIRFDFDRTTTGITYRARTRGWFDPNL